MGRKTSGVVGTALSVLALVLALVLVLVLVPAGMAGAMGADTSLVGHWKLDGNADDYAGGHHGTLVGHATWADDLQRGWCLDLDGSGSYVDIGDDPALTFSDAITVACWIKVRRLDRNWSAIVTKGDDWVLARTRDDGRIAFLCLGLTGGGWPEVYSGDVNDGNWHHIAGAYDGDAALDLPERQLRRVQSAPRPHQQQLEAGPHRRKRTDAQPLLERPDRRRAALPPGPGRRGDRRAGRGQAPGCPSRRHPRLGT